MDKNTNRRRNFFERLTKETVISMKNPLEVMNHLDNNQKKKEVPTSYGFVLHEVRIRFYNPIPALCVQWNDSMIDFILSKIQAS